MIKNLKKYTYIILCIIIFVGCSKNTNEEIYYSKEQLLDEAIEMDYKEISLDIAKNPVMAQDKYEGKKCIFKGYIGNIFDADYIELNWYSGYWADQDVDEDYLLDATSSLRMDLDDEDAKTVLKGDIVTVVGILSIGETSDANLLNAYLID